MLSCRNSREIDISMPNLELSQNYIMVQSDRGTTIMKNLIALISDDKFWNKPSSDEIADRILSILSKDKDIPLAPIKPKSKKQPEIEAFLIGHLLDSIKSYYHSTATLKGFRRIDAEKPSCFQVAEIKPSELNHHLDKLSVSKHDNRNKYRSFKNGNMEP